MMEDPSNTENYSIRESLEIGVDGPLCKGTSDDLSTDGAIRRDIA